MSEDFILVYVMKFSDGSIDGDVLHVGTVAECEQVQDSLPGIVYGGEKTVVDSWTTILSPDAAPKIRSEGEI